MKVVLFVFGVVLVVLVVLLLVLIVVLLLVLLVVLVLILLVHILLLYSFSCFLFLLFLQGPCRIGQDCLSITRVTPQTIWGGGMNTRHWIRYILRKPAGKLASCYLRTK